jgi:hypothetical protein
MTAAVFSKDIIFAFFGLFLSVLFTQGLFQRILSFVYELSYSIIPFGFEPNNTSESKKYTKADILALNNFEVSRTKSLEKIIKSITCNAAIAMTVIVIAITSAAFKITGLPINNFDIVWGGFLTLSFVYLGYYTWNYFCKTNYWSKLPPMSASKYNILITIFIACFCFYIVLQIRGAFNYWIFYIFSFVFIYLTTRLHRVPHINSTHRRAIDFQETEAHYLEDIGREYFLICVLFTIVSFVHFNYYLLIKNSSLGQAIEAHPIRNLLAILCIPFIIFLINFIRFVGWQAILNFIFFTGKKNIFS